MKTTPRTINPWKENIPVVLETNTFYLQVEDITIEIKVGCKTVDGGKDDPDYVVPDLLHYTATRPQPVTITRRMQK